jgi:starch synthase
MTVLFGHAVGNPNSYEAARAYFDAGMLEAFCVPWMPSRRTIDLLNSLETLRPFAQRLGRRSVPSLSTAPKIQAPFGEIARLAMRSFGLSGDQYSEWNNHWLMRTMARECRRPAVTMLHAYEDCSLGSFREAKRRGKACIYDLPTCYFAEWENVQVQLNQKFLDWLPATTSAQFHTDRRERKKSELELADLILVASRYVERTVREFDPNKQIALAQYGVDTEFWTPGSETHARNPLRFIYAGQISVRKGIPLLLQAWSKADLHDASLTLVGSWALNEQKRKLPQNVIWMPPCSPQMLRELYRQSDVCVFPSYSDGFGLVILEAMACGLPVIASEACAAPEIITPACGWLFPAGNLDQLIELLRGASRHREAIQVMGREAQAHAGRHTWQSYRMQIQAAVAKLARLQ